jgi:hypothetical protein
MRRNVTFATACLLACCASTAACREAEQDDVPPIEVKHLGVSRGKSQIHVLQVTLVNRHDRPLWFVVPGDLERPLEKSGTFKNNTSSKKAPFGGFRHYAKGDLDSTDERRAIVELDFNGSDTFTAFHVPAHGRIVLDGLTKFAPRDFKFSEFSGFTAFEAKDLLVNGNTPIEDWLPFDTMSSEMAEVAREPLTRQSLNWDKIRRAERDDYPTERVEFIQATEVHQWPIRFEPPAETTGHPRFKK